MKLNFYCIGSSKCGTSSLHDILYQHPDVFLPTVKETKFLSLNYTNGVDWYYDEYFDGYSSESAVGKSIRVSLFKMRQSGYTKALVETLS